MSDPTPNSEWRCVAPKKAERCTPAAPHPGCASLNLYSTAPSSEPTCPTATCHGCPDPEACDAIRPVPSSDTPSGEREILTPRQQAIEAILIRHQDHAFSFVARRIDALFTAPTPVPEASGRGEVVQPTMHILRRADGEEMGEFAFWATDGPDGWDMAEDTDHDEDTVYEILACYPVARRKILRSTLCETCDGEGDGCPACAGSGECEPPDAEHMPIIARPAPSSSPVGDRGLDVTALPEWEALRAAAECGPLVRVAVEALRLLAAADREGRE